MKRSRSGSDAPVLNLTTAVQRLEPTLRGFLAGALTFDEFSHRFEQQYWADLDSYDWDTQGVLGVFFTDYDQTAKEPNQKFHETTIDAFRPKVAQLLTEALGTTDR